MKNTMYSRDYLSEDESDNFSETELEINMYHNHYALESFLEERHMFEELTNSLKKVLYIIRKVMWQHFEIEPLKLYPHVTLFSPWNIYDNPVLKECSGQDSFIYNLVKDILNLMSDLIALNTGGAQDIDRQEYQNVREVVEKYYQLFAQKITGIYQTVSDPNNKDNTVKLSNNFKAFNILLLFFDLFTNIIRTNQLTAENHSKISFIRNFQNEFISFQKSKSAYECMLLRESANPHELSLKHEQDNLRIDLLRRQTTKTTELNQKGSWRLFSQKIHQHDIRLILESTYYGLLNAFYVLAEVRVPERYRDKLQQGLITMLLNTSRSLSYLENTPVLLAEKLRAGEVTRKAFDSLFGNRLRDRLIFFPYKCDGWEGNVRGTLVKINVSPYIFSVMVGTRQIDLPLDSNREFILKMISEEDCRLLSKLLLDRTQDELTSKKSASFAHKVIYDMLKCVDYYQKIITNYLNTPEINDGHSEIYRCMSIVIDQVSELFTKVSYELDSLREIIGNLPQSEGLFPWFRMMEMPSAVVVLEAAINHLRSSNSDLSKRIHEVNDQEVTEMRNID